MLRAHTNNFPAYERFKGSAAGRSRQKAASSSLLQFHVLVHEIVSLVVVPVVVLVVIIICLLLTLHR